MSQLQSFVVPKMGESITEGTILNWLVQEGESFQEGDILVEIATDKVDNEVPALVSGVMGKHMNIAGDTVAIGSVIAQYEEVDSSKSSKSNSVTGTQSVKENSKEQTISNKQIHRPEKAKAASNNVQSSESVVLNSELFISPLVDAIARENHISYEELARIPASGMENRLRKSDVINYLNDGRPYQFAQIMASNTQNNAYTIPQLNLDKGTGRIVEMDRMRSMIADHMVYSKHTSPHVTTFIEADLTELVRFRESVKADFQNKYGEKLTYTPFLIHAVALAIKEFPNINASVDGKNIIIKEVINIGMATALPNGNLIVPVVKNADQKSIPEITADVNRMASLARENKLGGDDIKGGTFTISNVGTFGSLMGTPIINQPEVAILATGIIKKRAEVLTRDGVDTIEIRSMMMLSLSFDHRVVDGFLAGSFLKAVALYLEDTPVLSY